MYFRPGIIFSTLLWLCAVGTLSAQQPQPTLTDSIFTGNAPADFENGTLGQRFAYDMGSVYKGILFTYSGPARWKKDDFIKAGAFAGGTALLVLADEDVAHYFRKQGQKVPQEWHHAGWYMGKPQYNYTFSLGLYAAGLLTKNTKIRRTGVVIITAATTGGLLQTVLKSAIGRARPGTGVGNMSFDPFSKSEGYHSFPSGHSILSTTVFYALSKQFSSPWVKAGFYTAGLLTPVSRMWEDAHWISDVVVGAGIAVVCVESAEHFLKKSERYATDRLQGKSTKISWNLRAGLNQVGVVGTF